MRGRSTFDQDIYTIDAQTGGDVRRPIDSAYNEHALYSCSGKFIVWMNNRGNRNGATDWWMMQADGSEKHRLTSFNDPGQREICRRRRLGLPEQLRPR